MMPEHFIFHGHHLVASVKSRASHPCMTLTGTPLSVQTHVSVPHCNTAIIRMDPCIWPTLWHCHRQYGPMYLCHTATLPSSVRTHVSVPHCNTAIISLDPCICATLQSSVWTHVYVPWINTAAVSTDPCICPTMRPCRCQYWPMYLSHTVTLPLSRPTAMWEVQVEMVLQVMLVEKGHTTSGLCSTSETQQTHSKLTKYKWRKLLRDSCSLLVSQTKWTHSWSLRFLFCAANTKPAYQTYTNGIITVICNVA